MAEAPYSIAFDFSGSLELARRLVATADTLHSSVADRRRAFETALRAWTGPRRDHVAHRLSSEHTRFLQVEALLRAEADGWARAWARAADEHNQLCWRWSVEAAASLAEPAPFKIEAPTPVEVPLAPTYLPTSALWPFAGGRPGSGFSS